jgi:hypothetical protein
MLGTGVGNLQDYLTRLLIKRCCRENARKGVCLQLGSEYLLAIQLGEDAVAYYLQLDIVPLAGFNLAWAGSNLTLGAIHDRLHTVLGIVPATEVQPAKLNLFFTGENSYIDGSSIATGIEAPIIIQKKQTDGKWYNLAGQQVDKNYKGVVIVNGKKFINR